MRGMEVGGGLEWSGEEWVCERKRQRQEADGSPMEEGVGRSMGYPSPPRHGLMYLELQLE